MTNEPTWHDVNDRYGAQLAPPDLRITQTLANSSARTPEDYDPLHDLATAQPWLDALTREWTTVHGGPEPRIKLSRSGLEDLRRLRTTVRAILLRDDEADPVSLRVPVDAAIAGARAELVPTGTDGHWLESAVGAELVLAHRDDTLRRLKLCREPLCRTAFYDLSKNNSKVWHNLDTCGTPQRMREYRQRLRNAD
ncbi:CGNR zinc finger domain-containing protein [Amycolatopsis sp. NPDC049253]|uniref:CGNR zinc finger domain-containing protein n=1 Tax=Amycolatopsis sp. NPDC049253 TaxID=3155274 RepID=UPI0034310DF3